MNFRPVRELRVSRTLSNGEMIVAGTLAQNRQGTFFQYDAAYLDRFGNLSPFALNASNDLQLAPGQPHNGLHGVFGDCLPDGWGLLLQDRVFRRHDISPTLVTSMDRLAFVGLHGMGALSFAPVSEFHTNSQASYDLATLGLEAQALFDKKLSEEIDDQSQKMFDVLAVAGSSGGARPKAQIFFHPNGTQINPQYCRIHPEPGDEAWLVKFTSKNLPLGHEEGLCEAVYLQMAELANLQPPSWKLIPAHSNNGAIAWLAVKRFDWLGYEINNSKKNDRPGKLHMHSACGLLDADFRMPSLDYAELIKASRQLCKSPKAGQLQYRRAIFNLFSANQDDHSKNWSFLQNDTGSWQVAPFYDTTYSPHPFNEHATAFGGYGKQPPLKTIQKLAATAGFSSWAQAKNCIEEVVEALSKFSQYAKGQGVQKSTISVIQKTLNQRRIENSALL